MQTQFPGGLLEQLRAMVQLLAAPAPLQIAWLVEHKVPVDELALQFYDVVPAWFPDLEEDGLLHEPAKQALLSLNESLGVMSDSGRDSLWITDEALYSEPEWEHIRELAKTALEMLRAVGS